VICGSTATPKNCLIHLGATSVVAGEIRLLLILDTTHAGRKVGSITLSPPQEIVSLVPAFLRPIRCRSNHSTAGGADWESPGSV
jgi:hypothetical protein